MLTQKLSSSVFTYLELPGQVLVSRISSVWRQDKGLFTSSLYFLARIGFHGALMGKQERKCQSKALCCLCLSKAACVVTGLWWHRSFLLILLQPWSCSRAWLGALCVCLSCTQRQEPTACAPTHTSVSAHNFWPFCVHRTDLLREVARLSPSCAQLNSCLWPGLPRSQLCRPGAAPPVPVLWTALYPRKAPSSVPAAC